MTSRDGHRYDVRRAPDFAEMGEYAVEIGGRIRRMHRNPENGWWYETDDSAANRLGKRNTHYVDRFIGFNKQEALNSLARYYAGYAYTIGDQET